MAALKDLLEALKIPHAATAAPRLGSARMPALHSDSRFAPSVPATLMANAFEMIDPNYWDGAPELGGGRRININITQMRDQFRANMAAAGRDPASFTWNDLFDPELATVTYKGQQFLAGDLLTRAIKQDPKLAELYGQNPELIARGAQPIADRILGFAQQSLGGGGLAPAVPGRATPKGERADLDGLLQGVALPKVALHHAGPDPDSQAIASGLPSDRFIS